MGPLHSTRRSNVVIIHAGILFPASIFEQPWFFYLSAFVAFNTIVFVGLSLAKLVMWPRPRIPDDTVPLMSQKGSSQRQPIQDLFPEPGPGPRGT